MRIIAVDFDGTLCKNAWPDIGEANREIIDALAKRQAEGDKIILWTCRVGAALAAAVMWSLNQGLRFDAVNRNLPEMIETFGNDCRKVYADEYWDDKAVMTRGGDRPLMVRFTEGGTLNVVQWRDDSVVMVFESPVKMFRNALAAIRRKGRRRGGKQD